MNGHAIREAARAVAVVVHDGQSRKGAGEPYFNHVDRVAEAVWGWRAKAIAYLHDTVEDADNPERMLGALTVIFPPTIITGVLMLTRLGRDEEGYMHKDAAKPTYDAFIRGIIASNDTDVIAVKLADVDDNLRDIEDIPDAQSQKIRYLRAKAALEEAIRPLTRSSLSDIL